MIYEFLDVSLFQSNLIHVFRIFFPECSEIIYYFSFGSLSSSAT